MKVFAPRIGSLRSAPAARTRRSYTCNVVAESSDSRPRLQTELDPSRLGAFLRAKESSRAAPLFKDPFAEILAENFDSVPSGSSFDRLLAENSITTRYIDEQLLLLAMRDPSPVDKRAYNQVVLVGDGFDTRPFRLPWPSGTVIYLVAPAESHEKAEAVLAGRGGGGGARVPQGCLLKRIDANFKAPASWAESLERAGFRGDRLSAWGLQGLSDRQLSYEAWSIVMQQIDFAAAFDSVVVGELPEIPPVRAANLLAENGLLGRAMDLGDASLGAMGGRWEAAWGGGELRRRLFYAEHQRPSLEQLGIYQAYRSEMESVDEDYTDNIT